ncbi:hypothetical protein [Geopseudomonas aromaticivorans]
MQSMYSAGDLAVLMNAPFSSAPVIVKVLGSSEVVSSAIDVEIVVGESPITGRPSDQKPIIAISLADMAQMGAERYTKRDDDPVRILLDDYVRTIALHYLSFREGMTVAALNFVRECLDAKEEEQEFEEFIDCLRLLRADLAMHMDFDVLGEFCNLYDEGAFDPESDYHDGQDSEFAFVEFVKGFIDFRYRDDESGVESVADASGQNDFEPMAANDQGKVTLH